MNKDHLIKWKGRIQSAGAWAAELGIDRNSLNNRLRAGWKIARALNLPDKKGTDGKRKKHSKADSTAQRSNSRNETI